MNLSLNIWRCIIILLLNFSIKRCPLLPAGCQRFKALGKLTVEPAPLFLIGSNLRVYCHIENCQQRFKLSLELNDEAVDDGREVNCTTVMFNLPTVRVPQSKVVCKLKSNHLSRIVNGLDLHVPPDKPENITCETTRSSTFIDCSWKRGQKTYIPTTYNISVKRENGTQIHLDQIQDAEEITIPQGIFDKNTKFQLIITAYNHFGVSQSDLFILCVKDIVKPETPHIMQVEFGNGSIAAVLQWKTLESSVHLTPYVRLRTHNGFWELREETELGEGLIRVNNLRPLTEYEFQMRICQSVSVLTCAGVPSITPRSTPSKRSVCSKWSTSVTGRSPGKGPSQQLHVWRMFGSLRSNGPRNLTVLWKPPPPEDYSGEVQQYKIFLAYDQKQKVTCPATSSQWSVQVPAEVQELSISAVTSYGSSPPADVPIKDSSAMGPVLRELAPAADGGALLISWSWPGTLHWSTSGGELLHYVVEWMSVPATELQWQKLDKNPNNASITGLAAGVRYNISLYAVTTRGVSAPSSRLVYSKEQKPVSAPNMMVLSHETRRILVLWDELPVDQQRGFITNYTFYVQTLDSNKTALIVTVPGSGPRQMWLVCPEGALVLQLTASTSAGEGPLGSWVSSQPAAPAAGLMIVTVFIITLIIAIIANLMCWSCVRERIKQRCISWGPSWLDQNLPKLGNSNAIRLLQQEGSELSFSSDHSDPPLSPITLISRERMDNVYPSIQIEVSKPGSGKPTAETPLTASETGTMLVDSQLEHVSYKPQIAPLASQGEEVKETEEEQRDILVNAEEVMCSGVFGGLIGGLLSSVEVDFSDTPLGSTLSSLGDLLHPKTPETIDSLRRGSLVERRGAENEVHGDSPSLQIQQGLRMTPDMPNPCLSQYTVETILTGGYFPQIIAVSSAALCDTQR